MFLGQSDLAPIEEHIEIQDETEGFKGMKQGAKRSSLEHLHEENCKYIYTLIDLIF